MMHKANVVSEDRTPCSRRCGSKAVTTGSHNEPLCRSCMMQQLNKAAADRLDPSIQDLGSDPNFVDRHSD